jgi:hypothetical protein
MVQKDYLHETKSHAGVVRIRGALFGDNARDGAEQRYSVRPEHHGHAGGTVTTQSGKTVQTPPTPPEGNKGGESGGGGR